METVLNFLRARWDHLRRDRVSQIILLACLVSFPPAFYYQKFFLRAVLLAVLVLVLVVRSSSRSWSRDVTARLNPALPADVAFYRLFLVDPLVMGHVAQIRTGLNVFLSLLVFNNALLLLPMDVVLGGLFFLYFAGQEERFLFRQAQLPAAPAGGSTAGGFRSSFEYFMGHAQKNPKQWAVGTAVMGGLGYLGKSTVDGWTTQRTQIAIANHQAQLDLSTARGIADIETVRERDISQIRMAEAAHRINLEKGLDDHRTANRIRLSGSESPSDPVKKTPADLVRDLDAQARSAPPSPLSPLSQVQPELPKFPGEGTGKLPPTQP